MVLSSLVLRAAVQISAGAIRDHPMVAQTWMTRTPTGTALPLLQFERRFPRPMAVDAPDSRA